MASALAHMQQRRKIHRDLKPANILIHQSGILKLGDLGLSRSLCTQTYQAYSKVGTPLYMSPQVLQGIGYDSKSDVWSLGCVTYELCCLKSPFRKQEGVPSLYELFKTINKGEYRPIKEHLYSQNLRMLIDNMIKVDKNERFDIQQVVDLCEIQKKQSQNVRPKIDPILLMDDIMEKLRLLDYQNIFCKQYQKPPISRIYFAYLEGDPKERLHYFHDLTYWLMSFGTNSTKEKNKPKFIDFQMHSSMNQMANKVLADVKSFGVKLSDSITPKKICNVSLIRIGQIENNQSYGDSVCQIINNLLNKELTRRNFRFQSPDFEIIGPGEISDQQQDKDEQEDLLFKPVKLSQYLRGNNFRLATNSLGQNNSDDPLNQTTDEIYKPQTTKTRGESAQRTTLSTMVSDNDITTNSTESLTSFPLFNQLNAGIIQSTIDAHDWRKEYQRVKKQLVLSQSTILQTSNQDSNSAGQLNSISPDDSNRLQTGIQPGGIEYLERLKLMKHHLNNINQFKTGNGMTAFEDMIDGWNNELLLIRQKQIKLNQNSSHLIEELTTIVEEKKKKMPQVIEKRDTVKQLINQFDELTSKLEKVQVSQVDCVQSCRVSNNSKKLLRI